MGFNRLWFTIILSAIPIVFFPVTYGGNWWFVFGAFIFILLPIAFWKEYSKPLETLPEIYVRDHSHYSSDPLYRKVLDGENMDSELLLKMVKLC